MNEIAQDILNDSVLVEVFPPEFSGKSSWGNAVVGSLPYRKLLAKFFNMGIDVESSPNGDRYFHNLILWVSVVQNPDGIWQSVDMLHNERIKLSEFPGAEFIARVIKKKPSQNPEFIKIKAVYES